MSPLARSRERFAQTGITLLIPKSAETGRRQSQDAHRDTGQPQYQQGLHHMHRHVEPHLAEVCFDVQELMQVEKDTAQQQLHELDQGSPTHITQPPDPEEHRQREDKKGPQ